MTPSSIFTVANLLPMPIWLLWMAAPSSRLSRRIARTTWPWALLASLYFVLMAVALAQRGLDPHAFGSLHGVMAAFRVEWIALAGWVHYLCFDLFVARWIMNDAPEGGYWLTPILFLTLMFGPIGLLLYLAARRPLGFDR